MPARALTNPLRICNSLFLSKCQSYCLCSAFASFGDQFFQGPSALGLYRTVLWHYEEHRRASLLPFLPGGPHKGFVRQLRSSFQGPCRSHQSYRNLCLYVWWSQGQHPRKRDCVLGQCLPEGWVAESNYTKDEKIQKGLSERKYLSGA